MTIAEFVAQLQRDVIVPHSATLPVHLVLPLPDTRDEVLCDFTLEVRIGHGGSRYLAVIPLVPVGTP